MISGGSARLKPKRNVKARISFMEIQSNVISKISKRFTTQVIQKIRDDWALLKTGLGQDE